MAKITYPTKQPIVDPENPQPNELFYAVDANEVKTSVNSLYDTVDTVAQNAIDGLAAAIVAQEDIEDIEVDIVNIDNRVTVTENAVSNFSSDQITLTIFKVSNYATL